MEPRDPHAAPSAPPTATATSPRGESLDEAHARFLEAYPSYLGTAGLDALRADELSRLDEQGQVYLDYTGGGLYGASQIERHRELLLSQVFGNPHSTNPTSLATTELIERCRRHVLDYFNASPDEYVVIFTANASHALKLVGESYPFRPGDRFLLTFDNHNSVNGIREYDRAHGAETTYVPVVPPELRVDEETLIHHLDQARSGPPGSDVPGRAERALERTLPSTICSPTRPSPTSPASSIRSSGSSWPRSGAGTCCSTPRPSSRPTAWTSRAGTRTTWRCRSTRCSATPPASAP